MGRHPIAKEAGRYADADASVGDLEQRHLAQPRAESGVAELLAQAAANTRPLRLGITLGLCVLSSPPIATSRDPALGFCLQCGSPKYFGKGKDRPATDKESARPERYRLY